MFPFIPTYLINTSHTSYVPNLEKNKDTNDGKTEDNDSSILDLLPMVSGNCSLRDLFAVAVFPSYLKIFLPLKEYDVPQLPIDGKIIEYYKEKFNVMEKGFKRAAQMSFLAADALLKERYIDNSDYLK